MAWPLDDWRVLLILMGEIKVEKDVTQLTPREAQMACLAAQGFTQQQIAEELCLSVNYVKRVLSDDRVYGKVAAAYGIEAPKVNQALLGFLLRPYMDWVKRGRPPI